MGRPRKQPVPDEGGEEPKGKTTKLKYDGPSGQVVVGLGALENGETYEVEAKLAKSLVASSVHWKEA